MVLFTSTQSVAADALRLSRTRNTASDSTRQKPRGRPPACHLILIGGPKRIRIFLFSSSGAFVGGFGWDDAVDSGERTLPACGVRRPAEHSRSITILTGLAGTGLAGEGRRRLRGDGARAATLRRLWPNGSSALRTSAAMRAGRRLSPAAETDPGLHRVRRSDEVVFIAHNHSDNCSTTDSGTRD